MEPIDEHMEPRNAQTVLVSQGLAQRPRAIQGDGSLLDGWRAYRARLDEWERAWPDAAEHQREHWREQRMLRYTAQIRDLEIRIQWLKVLRNRPDDRIRRLQERILYLRARLEE
jgi:hypothetical protein